MNTCAMHTCSPGYRRFQIFSIVMFLLLLAFWILTLHAEEWPRDITAPEAVITIYQPQLESFEDDRLSSRAAVAVRLESRDDPVFGTVWFDCRIETDRDTRTVELIEAKVTEARFPEATEESLARFREIVENEIPRWELELSLDRLLVGLELIERQNEIAEGLNNEAPTIIFTPYPAVLVQIDGKPKLRQIENTGLAYVANTPFSIILKMDTKTYYLKGGEWWYAASDVEGPWNAIDEPPQQVVELVSRGEGEAAAAATATSDTLVVSPDSPPEIVVRTGSAELISADGEPEYTPISGTGLLFMANTESEVFLEIDSQHYFVLLSGRWFTSTSLTDGPWSYVSSDELPEDFRRIPPESERGSVLASVAGTREAREAMLDNQIPQTAVVDRADAELTVEYDGDPQFEKIGDTDMSYAVNTDKSVLEIEGRYYCCHEAVWYEATDPAGPWEVCIEVPENVQELPPESPVYNVKYVYVYDYTPSIVYVGYTPGYVHSYVYRGCVVYGTGYYYRPWYGTHYYPRPVTWGWGVRWNPYYGWSFSFGVRIGGPYGWIGGGWYRPPPAGWWGPAGYRHGYYAGYRHGYYRGKQAGSNRAQVEAYRRQVSNNIYKKKSSGGAIPSTRDVPARKPGSAGPSTSDVPSRKPAAGVPATRDLPAQKPGGATPSTRDAPKATRPGTESPETRDLQQGKGTRELGTPRRNDTYSDRQGNVYRKSDSGWEQRSGSGWSGAGSGSAGRSQQFDRSKSDLNRAYDARQRGTQRMNSFDSMQRSGGGPGSRRGSAAGGGARKR